MRGFVWVVLGTMALAAPLAAQAPGRAGGALSQAGPAWAAVGRLDIGTRSFCTATLIAPDRALTAAHCVLDPQTGRAHPVSDMVLRLGLGSGRDEVTRGVVRVQPVDPTVASRLRGRAADVVAQDLAFLMLDQPVTDARTRPIGVSVRGADPAQTLTVVSYARGRTEQAALQDDCLLMTARPDGALVLDCDVDHGASGAPVLAATAEGPRIVAVVSARGSVRLPGFPDAWVALAAPVAGHASEAVQATLGAPPPPAAGVRIRRAGLTDGSAAGGARRVVASP